MVQGTGQQPPTQCGKHNKEVNEVNEGNFRVTVCLACLDNTDVEVGNATSAALRSKHPVAHLDTALSTGAQRRHSRTHLHTCYT